MAASIAAVMVAAPALDDQEAAALEAYRRGGAMDHTALHSPMALELASAMDRPGYPSRDHALDAYVNGSDDATRAAVYAALVAVDPDQEAWPTPSEIPPLESAPAMDPAMAPAQLRGWLVDSAKRSCYPLDYVVVPAMVALSSVVGRNIGIQPTPYDPYVVVPNLWGAIVGTPGVMKSGALGVGLKPIEALQSRAWEAFEAGEPARVAASMRREEEVAAFRASIRKTSGASNDVSALEGQLAATLAEQAEAGQCGPTRYVTQDATVEKLGELLRDNPRGLLVSRDELRGLFNTFEKAGREDERQFFLQAWEGLQPFTSDRIQRGTTRIAAPTVSVVGGLQPGVAQSLVAAARSGSANADGLLQRFQLIVWPDQQPRYTAPTRYPQHQLYEQALQVYERLDAMEPAAMGADCSTGPIPFLRFSSEAQPVYDAWKTDTEQRLRGGEFDDTPVFQSHMAKYRSLVPALALLTHLAAGFPGPVTAQALEVAIIWGQFLEAHARKVYAAELSPGTDAAHALLRKLQSGAVTDGITVRDVKQRDWAKLNDDRQVEAALDTLESACWLRLEERSTGGRPSTVIRVHPCISGLRETEQR